MKSRGKRNFVREIRSLPAWGVWIEIGNTDQKLVLHAESLPAWGVWIEIDLVSRTLWQIESLPAWGVWIEIKLFRWNLKSSRVAPRMGSVD